MGVAAKISLAPWHWLAATDDEGAHTPATWPTSLPELVSIAKDAGYPYNAANDDATPEKLRDQIDKWLECRLVVALEDTEWGVDDLRHTGAACAWANNIAGRLAAELDTVRLGVAAQLAEQCWQVRHS